MKSNNKRGTIEVQFNWVFVAIAGTVILLTLFGIGRRIFMNSKESLDIDIMTYLDEMFVQAETNADTEHALVLPDTTLSFTCDYYTIKDSNYEGNQIDQRIFFTPDELGEEIVTYTTYWEIPFKTAYFLLMTSPRNLYVFVVDNDDIKDELEDGLPEGMTKEFIDSAQISTYLANFKNENYDKIKFVFIDDSSITFDPTFGYDFSNIKGIKDNDVTAIKIAEATIGGNFPDGVGEVQFYQKEDDHFTVNGISSYYLNEASIYGAIFAEDKELYECNMKKALTRFGLLSAILQIKADELGHDSECQNLPRGSTSYYEEISQNLGDIVNSFSLNIDSGYFTSIYDKSQIISDKQYELEKNSCPVIY